ncbi:ribosomal-protein-alanine N-acetyltransferase [Salimicrobium jeotgali]|uniref:[Ribosomal protein bS18]-alanine N-acetyltransferase n=3 Tax=Salimicrobium TaxID=351195 RepID=K2G8A1_9BACI|nr:ribosomal-protein-alanine N-acetyltransferase [Salimicrobium jeotgali]MBM7696983.1 ribosomal-protein-alanine N-acetyltransferase [Salimicrobium jeotgali]SIS97587.1 [SSU ribosomal protein S18P]-alanine acetyltransferase [Salimicrobium salexigens]
MGGVRRMTTEDISRVVQVERATFPDPWPEDTFLEELEYNPYAVYFLIEDKGKVIGYCGIWLVYEEAHITNLAIHPESRGKRYGQRLFAEVMARAKQAGVLQITLEVRVTNTTAQHMYRRFGFKPGAIKKSYYPDNGEDALVMWVKL